MIMATERKRGAATFLTAALACCESRGTKLER